MVSGFKKTQLGINLSEDAISMLESSGKEVIRYSRQELSSFGANLIEITEDEIKFAAVFQKMLRENEFVSRDVCIALPAYDVIVRFFQIPLVSKKEISTTINFEARKYIPFRIEELTFDYISRRNKKSKNFDIIFTASKKRKIDKYIKVLNQVGFNILALEPASLSFLRAIVAKARLDIAKTPIIVNIDANLERGDIIILDSRMPCFIRDIKLFSSSAIPETKDVEVTLTKLINEIRISIDYFRHQRLTSKNNISEILLFSDGKDLSAWAQLISRELGIKCLSFAPAEIIGIDSAHCDLLKAVGASLRNCVSFPIDLDLLKKKEEGKIERGPEPQLAQVAKFFVFKPIFKKCVISVGLVILILIAINFWGNLKIKNLEKELKTLVASQQQIALLGKVIDFSESELISIKDTISEKVKRIKDTIETRVYVTEKIERLAALLPDGVWLQSLSFRKDNRGMELMLEGDAYLPSGENLLSVINEFLNKLRKDVQFSSGFEDIVLGSATQSTKGDFQVRSFQIKCR